MAESQRHLARSLVLKALYAREHGETSADNALDELIKEESISGKNIQFARDLIKFISDNIEWANENISALAENWRLERIAAIDRIILQMALVELKIVVDTPEKVVLNEAIELAKEYSTLESSRFINGILDQFLKNMKKTDKLEQ